MLMDMIWNLEAEADLSTDEDDIENLIPKYVCSAEVRGCSEREKGSQSSHTTSDDTSVPDQNLERSVLRQTPPDLSPGYTLNPPGTEVKYRPYVLVERLNKDLEAKLLASVAKKVIVTRAEQSKVLRKRGSNERAAILKEKKVRVSRKCVKKEPRKEQNKPTNSCTMSRRISGRRKLQRKAKCTGNASVKCTYKDIPVELPMRRQKTT